MKKAEVEEGGKKRCGEDAAGLEEQIGQKPRKELSEGTVIPAGQVRTDLFLPLQETQTWGRTDVLRLF